MFENDINPWTDSLSHALKLSRRQERKQLGMQLDRKAGRQAYGKCSNVGAIRTHILNSLNHRNGQVTITKVIWWPSFRHDSFGTKTKTKASYMFRYIAKLLYMVTDGLEERPNDRQEWEHSSDERQINEIIWGEIVPK